MWSAQIVINPPRLVFGHGLLDRQELIGIEVFVAELAVEPLKKAAFRRLSGANEVERTFALTGPIVERSRHELGALIHRDPP